jgi:multiple sugar transport system permease protein
MTIPWEYDDAARIDGCGLFGIYWRIILPPSIPAPREVAILTFMGGWDDVFGPLICIDSGQKWTLAPKYMSWRKRGFDVGCRHTRAHVMEVGVVLTIPPLVVFFFALRHFIQGIVATNCAVLTPFNSAASVAHGNHNVSYH